MLPCPPGHAIPSSALAATQLCSDVPAEADPEVVKHHEKLGQQVEGTGLFPASASAADITRALWRSDLNDFGLMDITTSVTGAGCYPIAALLNHSCLPNAVLMYDMYGPAMQVVMRIHVVENVAAGEEITHCYMDPMLPQPERQAKLRRMYGFDCKCRRCTDPAAIASDAELRAWRDGKEPSAEGLAELQAAKEVVEAKWYDIVMSGDVSVLLSTREVYMKYLHPRHLDVLQLAGELLTASIMGTQIPDVVKSALIVLARLKEGYGQVHPKVTMQYRLTAELVNGAGNKVLAQRLYTEAYRSMLLFHDKESAEMVELAKTCATGSARR